MRTLRLIALSQTGTESDWSCTLILRMRLLVSAVLACGLSTPPRMLEVLPTGLGYKRNFVEYSNTMYTLDSPFHAIILTSRIVIRGYRCPKFVFEGFFAPYAMQREER